MSNVIRVLNDHVANQIAAGEVVERPASVVKELVENAIDAGATRIRVELEEGGKSRIRVIDNGSGMSSEDALLALMRHATSKVLSADDLKQIGTLGFRGEALPSIRSVARLRLRTRLHDAVEGVQVLAEGDQPPQSSPSGGPPGTDIQVDDLFFNTPARRKFLRRAATEMSRITEVMNRFALGWPMIHFTVVHNGRKRGDYPAETALMGRIVGVLGREVCQRLFPVRLELGYWLVEGLVGEPSLTQSNARSLYCYVNQRFVRDRVLNHAISQAYAHVLERGRHPVGVLYLSIPADEVDVNVHPSKAEVRFSESGAVHSFISRAIKLTLTEEPWADGSTIQSGSSPPPPESTGYALGLTGAPGQVPVSSAEVSPGPHILPMGAEMGTLLDSSASSSLDGVPDAPAFAGFFQHVRVVGQAHHQYLICESPNALHFVDYHGAQQRVLYESLRAALASGTLPVQRLLFPAQLTLEPSMVVAAQTHSETLVRLGFRLEPFGGHEWVVSEVPHVLGEKNALETLVEVLSDLSRVSDEQPAADRIDSLIAMLACHAADILPEEYNEPVIRDVLGQLDGLPLCATCIHGRPIVVSYPFSQVARWFQRT